MSEFDDSPAGDLDVDIANLHREEVFSDMRAASIRRFIPVHADGSPDDTRPTSYIGDTTLVTQMGPLPVQFPIEADNLAHAFEQFPEGIRGAIERLNERAKEMAREEASRIVVPTAAPPGLAGGMPGAGGPGGKLVLK